MCKYILCTVGTACPAFHASTEEVFHVTRGHGVNAPSVH